MKLALASDHAGFELKEFIKNFLISQKIEVVDCGTSSTDSVDYPDFAQKAASLVSQGTFPRAILVCGTGIGMSMAANKFPGIRAAVATNVFMAKVSRNHNDANILCLGARVIDPPTAQQIVSTWLQEPFEGGRHEKRVHKISNLECQRSTTS